jgi:hypothetical protein
MGLKNVEFREGLLEKSPWRTVGRMSSSVTASLISVPTKSESSLNYRECCALVEDCSLAISLTASRCPRVRYAISISGRLESPAAFRAKAGAGCSRTTASWTFTSVNRMTLSGKREVKRRPGSSKSMGTHSWRVNPDSSPGNFMRQSSAAERTGKNPD